METPGSSRTVFAVALAFLMSAIAQTQPPLTLRTTTQLVEVSVTIRDAHGNPVGDLKQNDFELYDRGKRQEIRVFEVQDFRSPQSPSDTPLATAHFAPEHNPLPALATPPVIEFSNRKPADPNSPNAPTIIVIDGGNTWDTARMTWPDLVYAREQLIQYLRQVHSDDRLGIYFMGADRFWVLREYNQTCAELLQRLATWKSPEQSAPSGGRTPDVWAEFAMHFAQVDPETAKAIHRSQFWGTGQTPEEKSQRPDSPGPPSPKDHGEYLARGGGSLSVLQAVANHLTAIPGRKSVILISGTMFLPTDYKTRLEFLRGILQTGVTVYTVDPGGLAPYALDASFVIPSKVTAFLPAGASGARAAEQYIRTAEDTKRMIMLMLQHSLIDLAESTGGKAFVNTNDIRGAIRNSLDDSRVTYTLGFYPNIANADGSFHPIKVKVLWRDHLRTQHRDGYFEFAPARAPGSQELREAIWSPVDASSIELRATVSRIAESESYNLKLRIGLASLSLQENSDRWEGRIEVGLYQRDDLGNVYQPISDALALKLRQESYDKSIKTGLEYGRQLTLDPKTTSLRIVVRDLSNGNAATLTIPVTGRAN